jgi:hypothetical protein
MQIWRKKFRDLNEWIVDILRLGHCTTVILLAELTISRLKVLTIILSIDELGAE